MRKTWSVAVFLLVAGSAFAQYEGPGVESCRAYALKDLKANGNQPQDVVFEPDRNLLIERYTRKVGNQFVSSVLTGNGAVVYADTPSVELSFLCLLADDKRPVFFIWLPRQDTAALAQCTRDEALRAKARPCLETLLMLAEASSTGCVSRKRRSAARRRSPRSANRARSGASTATPSASGGAIPGPPPTRTSGSSPVSSTSRAAERWT